MPITSAALRASRESSIVQSERNARRAGKENGREDDDDEDKRSTRSRRGRAPPRVLSVGGNHSSDR